MDRIFSFDLENNPSRPVGAHPLCLTSVPDERNGVVDPGDMAAGIEHRLVGVAQSRWFDRVSRPIDALSRSEPSSRQHSHGEERGRHVLDHPFELAVVEREPFSGRYRREELWVRKGDASAVAGQSEANNLPFADFARLEGSDTHLGSLQVDDARRPRRIAQRVPSASRNLVRRHVRRVEAERGGPRVRECCLPPKARPDRG